MCRTYRDFGNLKNKFLLKEKNTSLSMSIWSNLNNLSKKFKRSTPLKANERLFKSAYDVSDVNVVNIGHLFEIPLNEETKEERWNVIDGILWLDSINSHTGNIPKSDLITRE